MMKLVYAIVIAIVSWMIFGSMNELISAHNEDGCCGTDSCGKSSFSGAIWTANLTIAIIATIIGLHGGAQMVPGYGRMVPDLPFMA